jgi:uncharacterized protein (TIGR03437 family)
MIRKPAARRFSDHSAWFIAMLLALSLAGMAPLSRAGNQPITCSAPGDSDQTIGYGTVAACEIINPQTESDLFHFAATSGETVLIVLTRTGGLGLVCMGLENPYGSLETDNCTAQTTSIQWPISMTGTYTIDVVSGGLFTAPQYTLVLERILPAASPGAVAIPLGQARGGLIDPVGDLDLYTVSGTPGQTLTVSVYRAGLVGTPCIEPLAPTGTLAAQTVCDTSVARATFTLSSTAPYLLLVFSQSNNSRLTYGIQVQCISGGCPQPKSFSLKDCLSQASLRAQAQAADSPLQTFLSVGVDSVPNCSLPTAVTFQARATRPDGSAAPPWLVISPTSGTFYPGANNTISASFRPDQIVGTGIFQAIVEITVPSLSQTARVPVTFAVGTVRPRVALSWNAFAFQAVENTAAPPSQILRIYNGVPGTLNWTILSGDGSPIPSWLTITPTTGSAGHAQGTGSAVVLEVNPAGLTAGTANQVYSALLRVDATGTTDRPQLLSISFHVVRSTAAPVPLLSAYGLVFNSVQGGTFPPPQTFQFSNTGGGFISGSIAATTRSGGNWLAISKATSNTVSGPDGIQVSVNPAGLAPGIYRGTITGKFNATNNVGMPVSPPDQTVDVALIVTTPGPITTLRDGERAVACLPTTMNLVGTTIGNGLNVPVSFPQILLAQVVDDCGVAVTGATVMVIADGQAIPLTEVGGGLYTGNWTPQLTNPSASITFTAIHPAFNSVQQSFTVAAVAASGGTALPTLSTVVEGAGFSQGRPTAPGGLITLFGANMAPPGTFASFTTIPLDRSLANTKVRIGSTDVPLYFVSPNQINAQLPFEVAPGDPISVVLNVGGKLSVPQIFDVAPAQPGIFLISGTAGAVLDAQFAVVTPQHPAHVANTIQIFAAGLGLTDHNPATGAPSAGLSTVQNPVTVTIGGVPAVPDYQGFAPGFVGLYQVNVKIPPGVPTGDAVPLVLLQNGVPSNPDLPTTVAVAP